MKTYVKCKKLFPKNRLQKSKYCHAAKQMHTTQYVCMSETQIKRPGKSQQHADKQQPLQYFQIQLVPMKIARKRRYHKARIEVKQENGKN